MVLKYSKFNTTGVGVDLPYLDGRTADGYIKVAFFVGCRGERFGWKREGNLKFCKDKLF
jgi:hypothetical protein